jgi:hypothetical protein
MRWSTKSTLFLSVPLVAACSSAVSAPQPTDRTSAAISPEQSFGSATYKFTLSSVQVEQANDTAGGHYVEYAGLATYVVSSNPTTNPPPAACQLSSGTGPVTAGSTLTLCENNTGTSGLLNGLPLTQEATVTTTSDIVELAVTLDNIETSNASAANASALSSGLGIAGGIGGGLGTLVAISAAGGPVGGVVGVIGAGLGIASSLFSSSGSNNNGAGDCAGGLVGLNSPVYLGTAPWLPGDPYIALPSPPRDSIYVQYDAVQLEQMTAYGPTTVAFPVSVQWPTSYGGQSVLMDEQPAGSCDSQHVINLTIERFANTGPASSALAGSTGVARTSSEVDAFIPDPAHGGVAQFQHTSAGWTTEMVTTSTYSVDSWMPAATVSRALPPIDGQMKPIGAGSMPYPDSVAGTNLTWGYDTFWFDTKGSLFWTSYSHGNGLNTVQVPDTLSGVPSGNLTATSRTPENLDVFWVNPYGNLVDASMSYGLLVGDSFPNLPSVIASGATPGGGVSAVSLTPGETDVFYIGADGALQDARWTGGWTVTEVPTENLGYPGELLTAIARDANDIDVFFAGQDGLVVQAHYTAVARNGALPHWTPATAINGTSTAAGGAIASVSRSSTTIDVAYAAPGGKIGVIECAAPCAYSSWGTPETITATSAVDGYAPISLVAPDVDDMVLFYTNDVANAFGATWSNTSTLSNWQVAQAATPAAPFSISLSASALSMSPEEGTVEDGIFNVLVSGSAGQTVNLSASGLPAGASVSFSPATVATGGQSLVTVFAGSAALQTFPLTITATGTGTETAISESATIPVTLAPCVPYTNLCNGACGNVTNGCGGTVNCGGCSNGKVCSEGICKLPSCNTPACECVASGGVWDGKYCE